MAAWLPPESLTFAADRADLARHEREARDHKSFNYAMFDAAETQLLGCIYIDPAERVGADADISWWVTDAEVGGPLDTTLAEFVPRWIADDWPFTTPRFIGRDLTWLGLVWDIGERQSDRHALYDGERERLIPARRKLESEGRAYPVAAAEVLDGLGAQLSTQVRSVLEAWTTALSAASGRKGLRSPMRCVSR